MTAVPGPQQPDEARTVDRLGSWLNEHPELTGVTDGTQFVSGPAAPSAQPDQPTPPVPDSDRWRQQVAKVLAEHRVTVTPTESGGVRLSVTPHADVAEALLPVLAQAWAEGAAEALEQAAKDWRWSAWSDVPRIADRVAERIGTANYVGDWIAARAAQHRTPRGDDRGE